MGAAGNTRNRAALPLTITSNGNVFVATFAVMPHAPANDLARKLQTAGYIADEETASHGEPATAIEQMIDDAVARMYSVDDANRFLEVTYQNGDKEILFFKDFSSGAMIENIVRRAKKLSIKRQIEGGEKGISTQDLLDSIRQEFREHEDLPNTTNPDDWAKISGKKGERIVFVRTLLQKGGEDDGGGRQIERVTTGQYL